MNILWHSIPAFFPSGYGVQTDNFVRRLRMLGHDIPIVNSSKHIRVPGMVWQGLPHLPGGPGDYGVEGVLTWTARLQPDLVITLFDIWPFPEDFGTKLRLLGVPWAAMAPVDHEPIPDMTRDRLLHAKYSLAMSPFAKREMEEAGLRNVRYIPHGVDTEIYQPGPQHKEIVGGNGKFVVGVVASNVDLAHDRKGWIYMIEAFGKFRKKHEDAHMYGHTVRSKVEGGMDLLAMSRKHGFDLYGPDDYTMWMSVPPEHLARIYNAFDVLLLLSKGEGFGVPLIEAQACGIPVIVTDYTAPTDLVGAGWKIPIKDRQWSPLNSYWGVPDQDAALEVLEEAYDLWKAGRLRREMQERAREFALQFDYDRVIDEHMLPFLAEVEQDGEAEEEKTVLGTSEGDGGDRQEADLQLSDGGIHDPGGRSDNGRERRSRREKDPAR